MQVSSTHKQRQLLLMRRSTELLGHSHMRVNRDSHCRLKRQIGDEAVLILLGS